MRKAFTIVELLIIVSVLVVLIGISIPRIKGMQDNSKLTQVHGELKTIRAALEAYKINDASKAYPATSTTVGGSYLLSATPRVISNSIPYDPFGGSTTTEYNYMRSSNGKYYVIWSRGINGTSQTTAISDSGAVTTGGDDICETNGTGCTPQARMANGCLVTETLCGTMCINTTNSLQNCGACGNVCGGGNNACCSSGCVNTSWDTNNCGSCGNVCPGGYSCCSGSCVDLQSNASNCGSCGNSCDYSCVAGNCYNG